MQQCAASFDSELDSNGRDDLVTQAAQRLWTAIIQHGLPYHEAIWRLEQNLLETALGQHGQTRREIAGRLQTSERTFYHKLRTHNLTRQALGQEVRPMDCGASA
jgi:DNA-binding NtrC family response regulator